MEVLAIALTATGGAIASWAGIWKLARPKARLLPLIVVAVLGLAMAGATYPSVHFHEARQDARLAEETNAIKGMFESRYGKTVELARLVKANKVYVAHRVDQGKVYVSLLVGDTWVELGEVRP